MVKQVVIGFCVRICLSGLRFVFAFDLGFDSVVVHNPLHLAAPDLDSFGVELFINLLHAVIVIVFTLDLPYILELFRGVLGGGKRAYNYNVLMFYNRSFNLLNPLKSAEAVSPILLCVFYMVSSIYFKK